MALWFLWGVTAINVIEAADGKLKIEGMKQASSHSSVIGEEIEGDYFGLASSCKGSGNGSYLKVNWDEYFWR